MSVPPDSAVSSAVGQAAAHPTDDLLAAVEALTYTVAQLQAAVAAQQTELEQLRARLEQLEPSSVVAGGDGSAGSTDRVPRG